MFVGLSVQLQPPHYVALRALCAAAAKNFSQIFAIRFFLGIFESAMLPGVGEYLHLNVTRIDLTTGTVFYLSTFYKRNELASRIGLFYGEFVHRLSGYRFLHVVPQPLHQ
jgi:hypothetical protein